MDLIYSFVLQLFTVNIAYADGVDDFVYKVNDLILNPLIGLLFAVALAVFLYGVVEFLMKSEEDEARTKGKKHMLWGIVGLFVMFSVWAILNLVLSTFDLENQYDKLDPENGEVKLNDYDPDLNFPE